MQIKMLSTFRSGGRVFTEGDTITVDDAFGTRMVTNGFAEDVAGVVATGAKPTGPQRIKPDDVYSEGGV